MEKSVTTHIFELLPDTIPKRERQSISRILKEDLLGRIGDEYGEVTEAEEQLLVEVVRRLATGEPIQYITGRAYFYGDFYMVTPSVLIPRPETEELVDAVVKYCQKHSRIQSVLEIGSGSGCISIALDKAIPRLKVTSIDISVAALDVAHTNQENLGSQVEFRRLDFLDEGVWNTLGTYDLIVSNPPYVDRMEVDQLGPGVLNWEPHEALFAENEGLIFYEKTARFGETHLCSDGMIFCELNEYKAQSVKDLFPPSIWKEVRIHKDMQGKDRMLVVER